MQDADLDTLADLAARGRRTRFANAETRAVLATILDDLRHRLEEGRIGCDDAAAIVARLSELYASPQRATQPCDLPALRAVLDPERFADRARRLAAAYRHLASRR